MLRAVVSPRRPSQCHPSRYQPLRLLGAHPLDVQTLDLRLARNVWQRSVLGERRPPSRCPCASKSVASPPSSTSSSASASPLTSETEHRAVLRYTSRGMIQRVEGVVDVQTLDLRCGNPAGWASSPPPTAVRASASSGAQTHDAVSSAASAPARATTIGSCCRCTMPCCRSTMPSSEPSSSGHNRPASSDRGKSSSDQTWPCRFSKACRQSAKNLVAVVM